MSKIIFCLTSKDKFFSFFFRESVYFLKLRESWKLDFGLNESESIPILSFQNSLLLKSWLFTRQTELTMVYLKFITQISLSIQHIAPQNPFTHSMEWNVCKVSKLQEIALYKIAVRVSGKAIRYTFHIPTYSIYHANARVTGTGNLRLESGTIVDQFHWQCLSQSRSRFVFG